MESTIFYKNAARTRANDIPVTFLLIEVLGLMQGAIEETDVCTALTTALEWAGLLPEGEQLTEQQLYILLERLTPKDDAGQEAAPAHRPPGKRTFASEFVKSYGKLSIAEKCLFAADYDFEVARRLYCVYDKEVSEEIIKSKFDTEFSRMQVNYEAVVFGMGGSFGGSSSADEGDVTDFAPDPQDDNYLDAAQDFVNMQHSFRSRKK